MPTTPSYRPPLALTASRFLRAELALCEQDAGVELRYTPSVPQARRLAPRRRILIISADKLRHLRRPIRCGDRIVILAAAGDTHIGLFDHAERIQASHVLILPAGRSWLVDRLRGRPPTVPDGSA